MGEALAEDLAGKVALVTGAGSGLGRGISLGLARKGVHVVLADIDLEGSRETARRMREQESGGRGYPVQADVTSEESVRCLLVSAIRAVGGVDILVNCAGIAPVHRLVDFPLREWQKALDVNLTGYFLVAREAARRMVRQATGVSIINISSKSGLQASENHSAYNATKAGEIHVARGWALELAAHGIRVNSVCPGNVFTESRIWNADYVKAIAEKRGIKPEEVIPYYINLTALKQEITWDDISDAVAFLASSRASKITGQTLVVDAGQVFVR
jgi:sorbitol-6-phosphate 2-dehydrogenase